MDDRLIAWARAVKSRRKGKTPVLWLFTDARRLPDPLAAVARLPAGLCGPGLCGPGLCGPGLCGPGLCGVVFRHDDDPRRVELGRALAKLCRRRRLALVVAGDWRLAVALRAGLHLRGGRRPGRAPRWCRAVTSSAHGFSDLRRARLAGVEVAFLSPVFATASHADQTPLGPVRWARLARGGRVGALGGIDGGTVRRLAPGRCAGVGAIGALG